MTLAELTARRDDLVSKFRGHQAVTERPAIFVSKKQKADASRKMAELAPQISALNIAIREAEDGRAPAREALPASAGPPVGGPGDPRLIVEAWVLAQVEGFTIEKAEKATRQPRRAVVRCLGSLLIRGRIGANGKGKYWKLGDGRAEGDSGGKAT